MLNQAKPSFRFAYPGLAELSRSNFIEAARKAEFRVGVSAMQRLIPALRVLPHQHLRSPSSFVDNGITVFAAEKKLSRDAQQVACSSGCIGPDIDFYSRVTRQPLKGDVMSCKHCRCVNFVNFAHKLTTLVSYLLESL